MGSAGLFAALGDGFLLDLDEAAHVAFDQVDDLLGGGALEGAGELHEWRDCAGIFVAGPLQQGSVQRLLQAAVPQVEALLLDGLKLFVF